MTNHYPWPKHRFSLKFFVKSHLLDLCKALLFLRTRPVFSAGISLLLGIALILPASLWLFRSNFESMIGFWDEEPGVAIYFELDASMQEIDSVKSHLSKVSWIEKIQFIAPEKALLEFSSAMDLKISLDLLGANPLPYVMRGRIVGAIESYSIEKLEHQLKKESYIEDVVFETEWIEKVNRLTSLINFLMMVYGVLFGFASIFISFSSIRFLIENNFEEIKILKLVGATKAQIRRPFLYCGAVYGLLGGLLGVIILLSTLDWMLESIQFLFGFGEESLEFYGMNRLFVFTLIFLGMSMGLVGAMISVGQRIKNVELLY